MKKILSFLTISALGFSLTAGAVFAKTSPITVECNDTIAGYSSEVEVDTLKNTNLSFMLETPSGKKIYLQESSDSKGELVKEIADYHLQKAGDYYISARFAERSEDFGQKCSFAVYPGALSKEKSLVTVNRKTAEAGLFENIITEVALKDHFGNPIKGHSVELLSSRAEDEIQLLSKLPYTDDNGAIAFLVNSEESGMSTLSAIDLTEDITLDARTKVAFISPDEIKAIGGDDSYDSYYEDASIFLTSIADVGEIYELIVELDTEEDEEEEMHEIEKNSSVSLTVSAVDELGNIVPNYTGTIRFSSTDENAILPEDYTFTSEDLGVHDFTLGTTFKTEGPQIVSVNDINDFFLKGETEFEIISGEPAALAVKKDVELTSPRAGIYSSNIVTVSGTATPGTDLHVYDTDYVIQELTSDDSGVFAAELKNMDEGSHVFYVVALGTDGEVLGESSPVELSIDTLAPVIESFDLVEAAEINEEITATLVSEPGLAKASILIEEQFVEMTESLELPGTYEALLTAPETAGEYEVDLVLEDEVGNENSFPAQTTLNVTAEATVVPSKVTEVTAVPSDGRVTFTWAAAEDDTYITNYKFSYGTAPDELFLEAKTFDSSTTWYIPNLSNGEENYFGIQAIDSDGNLGEMSDLVISAALEPEPELPASLEDPVVLEELPERTPETGPEIWFMVIASLLVVDIFYRRKQA